MAVYKFKINLDLDFDFEVEADDEDSAYEELWKIVGYDAEDILDHEPESEYMDIEIRRV